MSASLFTEFRLPEEETGSQVRAERECMQEYMGMITKVNNLEYITMNKDFLNVNEASAFQVFVV